MGIGNWDLGGVVGVEMWERLEIIEEEGLAVFYKDGLYIYVVGIWINGRIIFGMGSIDRERCF